MGDSSGVVLECCLEGIESAIRARDGGAHRIELCANLAQGGVTPSIGDIESTVSALGGSETRVHVLIRPRPGNFVYSTLERQVMVKDVNAAVRAGAHGVVIGALLADGGLDEKATEELTKAAASAAAPGPCSVTCCTTEPLIALETLVRLGVDRVLTSGREESAWGGRDIIAGLVEAGNGRIAVMPGAGVTKDSAKQLLLHTGARELHVGSGCHEKVPWNVSQQNPASLGPSDKDQPSTIKRVSERLVSEILQALA